MEKNGVLYNALIGFFVMVFVTLAVVCWGYAKTIKGRLLSKYSGKTEFDSLDIDILTTAILFLILFLIAATPVIYFVSVVFP